MNYDFEAMDMDMLNKTRAVLKTRWPEVVEDYLQDVVMYIDNIKAGFENGDKQAVAASAHPLKSSSNCMGVTSVGEIAKDMEYGAKEAIENGGDIAHLQELVGFLEESLKHAEPKLRDTLENVA